MIPLFKVFMDGNVIKYLEPVLFSGYIGEGPKTEEFERKFGEYIRNENIAVVNSGTSAITLALILAGVKAGDKVISSPMTCLATNMAIMSLGAEIIWGDVLPDGTLDPEDVENKLFSRQGLSTKAIVCVDWGGTPCKIKELSKYRIPLIEDACQSIGSFYEGEHVGNAADFTCFSFQAIKLLTTGDGGAVAMKDASLVDKAKLIRWFGLDRKSGASMRCIQDPPVLGYKMQMNDIAASIGLANLKHIDHLANVTKRNARLYNDVFGVLSDSIRGSSYWLYTIMVEDADRFIKFMAENGIECGKVHERNDTKTVFSKFRSYLPGVDKFDRNHVCIPVGWWVSEEEAEKIAKLVKPWI